MAEETESVGTVLLAGTMNLGIAVAKAIGGIVSGSSAMLSEAAHSVADTVTEVLLFTALKTSERPPDDAHPLGYGQALYVWAMLASVATFVGGAVFSFYDGIHTLVQGEELGSPLVSYIVLAVSFVLEGTSLLRGVRQVRGEAAGLDVPALRHLRRTPDTTVKAVVLEDTAALIGLVLAAGGLLAGQLTGSGVWDGVASICIGVLLTAVAVELGRSNASMLIGRALPDRMERALAGELAALPGVEEVLELVTAVQGRHEVLVAAKVDFRDAETAAEIERLCDEAERMLRERHPSIARVFLDPTPGRSNVSGNETGGASAEG
ncbi:cation diffusion facilitator family transporter [Phaeacidiphilus oryzae]|uniref:cation diffusion facilitator family transporter n=1 Tax=Phaeacidiphilus oryzae TaxID=348818 RepID=UPI002244F601|nr:cation diffusion facilitator family transporter [Phaeacidiphilus oryzae]